jgi:cation diffusion facilitator family transporter
MNANTEKKIVYKTSLISIIINVLLVIIKAIAGIVGNSKALISDAIHSLSDVFSTIVVMIGFALSRKKEDEDHPYGHERIECVAAVILASMLALTGGILGYKSLISLANGNYNTNTTPGLITVLAAILSITVKEGMFWYTRHSAKIVSSDALMADAWHHRSDALSSVGSLVGVILARGGHPAADSFAGIIICFFILKAAYDIYADAFRKMVDHGCDQKTVAQISMEIEKIPGVSGIHTIKTRMFGSKTYVDVELYVDGSMKLIDAHAIAEKVHKHIEQVFPEIKHCMVHVDPLEEKEEDEKISDN